MTGPPIHICGMGVVSALGSGPARHMRAFRSCDRGLRPLRLFSVPQDASFPAGEAALDFPGSLPRTHQLACSAADQAMAGSSGPPDAIVLGVTTGGMRVTEELLRQKTRDREAFRHHAVCSVTQALARRYGCSGPLITVSTACSSGAAAIKLAVDMLRGGMARRVLTGGADGLCCLTYFGFHSLQLIDPECARPLDLDRSGMSLADGAAMLLLSTDPAGSSGLCILGGGLSCDAFHPAAPHPEGKGAYAAMRAALCDAGVSVDDIDYINLHGTGTVENDRSEALAVNRLFGRKPPPVSSIKGSLGHSLAAAGAMEAVVTALCLQEGVIPPTIGFNTPDPDLNLVPVADPIDRPMRVALSNSFGFGGNNAALVIGRSPDIVTRPQPCAHGREKDAGPLPAPLMVRKVACLSGAGRTEATVTALLSGKTCCGCLPDRDLVAGLSAGSIRRLKRLPRLALALAHEMIDACPAEDRPSAISFGTGWGAMTETHDFLSRLFASDMQFPSPADFIGSVHNAPAGQIAMMSNITGANITTSAGDGSFEQALLTADLLTRGEARSVLVIAADEAHPVLSPLFDPSVREQSVLSDGGGAFRLQRAEHPPQESGVCLDPAFFSCRSGPDSVDRMIDHLGGADHIGSAYGMIMAGLPAAYRPQASEQLARFVTRCRFGGLVVDYRLQTGEFASASALAAAAAVHFLARGDMIPAPGRGGKLTREGKGILLLGLGVAITAVRIYKTPCRGDR